MSPSTIFVQAEMKRSIFKLNFLTVAGFDKILASIGSVRGELALNPWSWGAPCMPGGAGGTPVAAQETGHIHVSFKYLALEISPGTTLIQFTVSGSNEV